MRLILAGMISAILASLSVDNEQTTNARLHAASRSIDINWPSGEPSDLIIGSAQCDSTAYLLTTPRIGTVLVADLSTGRVVGHIGQRGSRPTDLQDPSGIAVDCSQRILYVIQVRGNILAFSLGDRRFRRSYEKPDAFLPSRGSTNLVDEDGRYLNVGGLWPKEKLGFMKNPRSQMFKDVTFGLRLSLVDGTPTSLFAPISTICQAQSSSCRSVVFDRVRSPGRASWVVAQPGGAQIALYGADRKFIRTLDVSSPLFVRDGSAVTEVDSVERQMAWRQQNSGIEAVFVFGDTLAVVHARAAETPWNRGDVLQFRVFMNLIQLESGQKLLSDVPLPDLPIGRADNAVWALDYGEGGRRPAFAKARLVMVNIPTLIRKK